MEHPSEREATLPRQQALTKGTARKRSPTGAEGARRPSGLRGATAQGKGVYVQEKTGQIDQGKPEADPSGQDEAFEAKWHSLEGGATRDVRQGGMQGSLDPFRTSGRTQRMLQARRPGRVTRIEPTER